MFGFADAGLAVLGLVRRPALGAVSPLPSFFIKGWLANFSNPPLISAS
jgi:hypothetical protein